MSSGFEVQKVDHVFMSSNDAGWLSGSANGAELVRDSLWQRWVMKRTPQLMRREILAECLGGLLAREVGLFVPDFAWADWSGGGQLERAFLSQYIGGALPWDPRDIDVVCNPEALGGILVLDLVTKNRDRHDGNLLMGPAEGGFLRVFPVDWGGAGLAELGGFVQGTRLNLVSLPMGGVLADLSGGLLREGALLAVERLCAIPQDDVSAMIQAAEEAAGLSAPRELVDVLVERLQGAGMLWEAWLEQRGTEAKRPRRRG